MSESETPIPEALSREELKAIVGRSHKENIIEWLEENGWKHVVNAAGEPIVGRWYARMKLAGVDVDGPAQRFASPAFDQVR